MPTPKEPYVPKEKRKIEYETVEMREVLLSFPSGLDKPLLFPEDTIEEDPEKKEGWLLRITHQRLGIVIKVYQPPLEYWSLRTFQHQRAKAPQPE